MPIYEYVCPKHGKFDRVILTDSGDSARCPKCGIVSKRILSAPAVVKVVHNEVLPFDARERVDDRARLMKDTKTKKMLKDYKEQMTGGG
jgi:putative FmdB family regulatory protein